MTRPLLAERAKRTIHDQLAEGWNELFEQENNDVCHHHSKRRRRLVWFDDVPAPAIVAAAAVVGGGDAETTEPPLLERLPVELLQSVVIQLKSTRDVLALASTNRFFFSLVRRVVAEQLAREPDRVQGPFRMPMFSNVCVHPCHVLPPVWSFLKRTIAYDAKRTPFVELEMLRSFVQQYTPTLPYLSRLGDSDDVLHPQNMVEVPRRFNSLLNAVECVCARAPSVADANRTAHRLYNLFLLAYVVRVFLDNWHDYSLKWRTSEHAEWTNCSSSSTDVRALFDKYEPSLSRVCEANSPTPTTDFQHLRTDAQANVLGTTLFTGSSEDLKFVLSFGDYTNKQQMEITHRVLEKMPAFTDAVDSE